MTTRVQLQPAFILHSRPFRETSAILTLFSKDFGQVSGLIQGVRSSRPSKNKKYWLQPFTPLTFSWTGKTDLVKLHSPEITRAPYPLQGKALLCGFYLNELCYRLLPPDDPYPNLYTAYQTSLSALETATQITLRMFEWTLLTQLGYPIELHQTQDTHTPINPHHWYHLQNPGGFIQAPPPSPNAPIQPPRLFPGSSLLAFHNQHWPTPQALADAKRLMRLLLQPLLGQRPLKSRELFEKA